MPTNEHNITIESPKKLNTRKFQAMSAQAKAIELGVSLEPQEKGYLNLCQSGNHLITSGHVVI